MKENKNVIIENFVAINYDN